MARVPLVFLFALVLSLAGTLAAQDADAPPKVSIKLLSDMQTLAPGQPFTLGVLVQLPPHWHTYWLNPGVAGLPPKVQFTTDSGVTFEPLQYPVPEKFGEGDTLAYGYENEVLYLIPAHAPASLAVGQTVSVKARIELLVCKTQCFMQQGEITLSLPVAEQGVAEHTELFDAWRARLPLVKPDWESAELKPPEAAGEQATIAVAWKNTPPATVELFPGSPQAVEVSEVTIENDLKRSVIRFVPELLERDKLDQGRMLTLVVHVDGQGQRRGSYVWVPVLPVNP